MIFPLTGRRSGSNRDTSLALLLHPIHSRRAIVDFAHAMEAACIKQDALSGRRLAGVNMCGNADIARIFE
jgi:hypothetical protein